MINRRNAMIKRKTGIAGKITKKLTITIIGGLAGAILAGTMPQQVQNFAQKRQEQTAVTAWWRFPKFLQQMKAINRRFQNGKSEDNSQ